MKTLIFALALSASLSAQVKLPPYSREVLPNGTVVYLVQKGGLPLVSFHLLVRGGEESETAALAGVSNVTAALLRQGSANHTKDQFSEELDGLGGTFGASVNEQSTVFSAEFLKKDFEQGLNLFAEALLHPTFPDAEFRKEVARRLDNLKSLKDNPGSINSHYRSFFFGNGHPYGHIADEASFDRIRRQDVTDYHQRMYVGKNLILIVAGDFDPAVAKARVAATFGTAPAGAAYSWVDDHPPVRNSSPAVLLIDKPDATQTYFIIAQPGIRRSTPDRMALTLVNTLFGGRFSSMINDELRVNSGLTYGANSRVEQARLTGALYISTYTKTETTEKAIDLALDVLKRFHDNGITADQLTSAKTYLKGTYPPQRLQTSDQIAAALGEIELLGLGRDEVDQFFARVDAVTLDQANEVIRKYYRTDNLTFVMLGNASKIREVAAKYGPKVVERLATQAGW
ncbi:MAG TPA: pitrilysin family protein [Bryobacteraceae bacterium]|nr:pitrilysin family protein [Bryobacteraceae bacterium]